MGSYLMNTNQVASLLNDISVETVATDTSLRPEIDYGVNYYKLMLNKSNNKWEFLYVPNERRSFGGEEIRKIFDDEASASKYYYLIQLDCYFFYKYIQPFELKNQDINFGMPGSTLKELKEAFSRLNMDPSYYSLDGKVKEDSMLLEKVNKEESKVYLIGQNNKGINASIAQEYWLMYSAMYQRVYYLYLLDQHYAELLRNKEIGHIFTDEDYKTLFTGVVIESVK